MSTTRRIIKGSFLMGLVALASACVVSEPREGYYAQPREGYYDRDHRRYYREHSWHECVEHDEYCR
jgi:hypothetical protein